MYQTKNKVFTIYRIFVFISILRRLAFNISKKWTCQLNPSLIGLLGEKTKVSWVLPFAFVIGAVAIVHSLEERQCKKNDLAVLNRGEHFHSPQNDENMVQFCGDFFNEKKKKEQSQFSAKRK